MVARPRLNRAPGVADVRIVNSDRVYRSASIAMASGFAGIYAGILIIVIAALTDIDDGDALQLGLGVTFSLWSLLRLRRCGVYTDDSGVRIVNPLSSTRLGWDEIRRFVLTARGGCRVETLQGASVNVFGIRQTMRGSQRTPEAAMLDELNRRLEVSRAARPASAR
jgi:hypothetical protein